MSHVPSAKWPFLKTVRACTQPLRTRLLGGNSRWFAFAALPVLLTTLGLYEIQTSAIEATTFSAISSRLSYKVSPGPSTRIEFPKEGPFNETRGYTALPEFQRRLGDAGFHVAAQSVHSRSLKRFAEWGITPPYDETAVTGLRLKDQYGEVLYDATRRQRVFERYEDIPPLVIHALLLVENRELSDTDVATRNPVIDWTRSAKAGLLYAGHKLGLPLALEGGSTLATQMEKFRYAEGGRTQSAVDKLRQMLSASLRVYRSGTDTRERRREIVLDYLNSVPLAAARGHGAVYGLGNGLHAWFGIELSAVQEILKNPVPDPVNAKIFRHVLALICSARAPSFYLKKKPQALEARVDFYTGQLENSGIITADFARAVRSSRLHLLARAPVPERSPYIERKASNAIRSDLLNLLGVHDLYALDRLDLKAETTLNAELQDKVLTLFHDLKDPAFAAAHGLRQRNLMLYGDPADMVFSLTLFERTNDGNLLRVQADTLNQPFDLNSGMKLELGSTAKLRTLAHYLEIVADLYQQFRRLESTSDAMVAGANDPITQWTVRTMRNNPGIDLETFLNQALDRQYSGNPGEVFFTGGGQHIFGNFDSSEDHRGYSLRAGLQQSVNLVYIRLMRDLVRFHQARLPYDPNAVMTDPDNAVRKRMLNEIADQESRYFLRRYYRRYSGTTPDAIVERILANRMTNRRLTMLFLAWNPEADAETLSHWLARHQHPVSVDEARRLFKSYDPARLNISDFGYLLDLHPLEVWSAGQIFNQSGVSWEELLKNSAPARAIAFRWLFQNRNRHAQNRRLRIRFEEDAFARMTPYWRRLGFPFNHLVPSLATAIGSSADRPTALAELMGILANDGVRLPPVRIQKLSFAEGTPYETVFQVDPPSRERVMDAAVARALQQVLAAVVESGTATRLSGGIIAPGGIPVVIGGKTGSGDNRFGSVRATSRTGTFAFYIGDRYFGVLTAHVTGAKAAQYRFTSALAVAALKLLAPALESTLSSS